MSDVVFSGFSYPLPAPAPAIRVERPALEVVETPWSFDRLVVASQLVRKPRVLSLLEAAVIGASVGMSFCLYVFQ